MELNENELKVLEQLRHDSRSSLVDLASRTGLSVSYVHTIIRHLTSSKAFRPFIDVDFSKLGCHIMVCFIVQSKKRSLVQEWAAQDSRVNDIFRINNGQDFFIEAIFRSMSEVYAFIEELGALSMQVSEHHVVRILAKEKMSNFRMGAKFS